MVPDVFREQQGKTRLFKEPFGGQDDIQIYSNFLKCHIHSIDKKSGNLYDRIVSIWGHQHSI